MTPAEYEQVVCKLVGEISSSFVDMIDRLPDSGRSNQVAGASHYKHQIDVSLRSNRWLVLIECKRWERRIRVQEVLVLASRATDIKAAHPECKFWVSLATTKGASRNAQKLAEYFHISLDCVRSAREYAVRLRNHVNLGEHDDLAISDRALIEVHPARRSDA
jgi:hypothetical protein